MCDIIHDSSYTKTNQIMDAGEGRICLAPVRIIHDFIAGMLWGVVFLIEKHKVT